MNLVFTRSKKKYAIPLADSAEVKLYAVPTAYSDDSHCLCGWGQGELEPVPACDQAGTSLLAHVVATRQDDGTFVIRELFCAKGVTYAQN